MSLVQINWSNTPIVTCSIVTTSAIRTVKIDSRILATTPYTTSATADVIIPTEPSASDEKTPASNLLFSENTSGSVEY